MRNTAMQVVRLGILVGLAAMALLTAAMANEPSFCWLDTHTRGVGTIPSSCPGREKIGALCYSNCPAGMKRAGFDCHSVCPEGMRDDGLYCRAAEYGRGAGYPWKFGDGFNNSGMMSRCNAANPGLGCEMNGAIAYPRCKPGYSAFGCCICRPNPPSCSALGLGHQFDLSCAKRIQIGDPKPMDCSQWPVRLEKDAGLCYPACRPGFTGVGPVCWSQTPPGWVNCGMGAAKSNDACGLTVFSQVASVGNLALTIATMGTSAAATGSANAATGSARLAQLKSMMAQLKSLYEANKKAVDGAVMAGSAGTSAYSVERALSQDMVTEEDIARVAAQIASVIDPSGVSSTVAAYTYPKCSKYFGSR